MSKKRDTILSGLNLNNIREGSEKTPASSAMIMSRSAEYQKEIARQSGRIADVLGANRAEELLKNENLVALDPGKVRMWALADRDKEALNSKDCADLIESMRAVGQVIPCIGRPVEEEDEIELIVGARRLFSAQTIAREDETFRLLAYVKPIDDLSAFKIMDAENRVREDISDWARARSYQTAIKDKQFKGREHLATQLGMPTAKLSKLLAFFDLPEEISAAFPHKPAFRSNWAYELLRGYRKIERDKDAKEAVSKKAETLRARQLDQTPTKHPIAPEDVYRTLLRDIERHIVKQAQTQQEPSIVGYSQKYKGFKLSVSNKGRMSFVFDSAVDQERIKKAAKAIEGVLGIDSEVSRRNQE